MLNNCDTFLHMRLELNITNIWLTIDPDKENF